MNNNIEPVYFSASKTIPDWMCSIERILSRRPAPSMHGPGRPAGWQDTWEAMRVLLRTHVDQASQVAQEIEFTLGTWPQKLVEDVRRITMEPSLYSMDPTQTNLWGSKVPSMYAVPTGRGMIFLVTAGGLTPAHIRQGTLMVHPWSRPDLPGWTTIKGEVELVDSQAARPWTWAAWKLKCLMTLIPSPETEPPELTIPDYLALQAAGLIRI